MSCDRSATYSIPGLPVRKSLQHALGNLGFTLVELIVVVAILGVLTLIAIPTFAAIKDRAREARAMGEIRGIEKSIGAYAIDHEGRPPRELTDIREIDQISLVDPWGRPYVYVRIVGVDPTPGRWGHFERLNGDYDLYSKGSDGDTEPPADNAAITAPLNLDDIVRAGDGSYVGLGRNY